MVDVRIYRTGLALVAIALIVFGFSLQDQPGAASTTLAPAAFNPANVEQTVGTLMGRYPVRPPGSLADAAVADAVATQLRSDGFAVTSTPFSARTALGSRALANVVAVRNGNEGGTIVVVSNRDPAGAAGLSGTAAMLELARVLSGETLQHSLMLVSTSGSVGAAGATELAGSLVGQQVDAVLVLGDMAAAHLTQPLVAPWSNGPELAPPMLVGTLATAVTQQAGRSAGASGVAGQLAHLAFPLSATEQAPFGARGMPAVLLSASGDRAPRAGEAISQSTITGLGRAALWSIGAIDGAGPVPSPSAYLVLAAKLVPAWAVRLLVLALIAPVLFAAVDALARARRRGYPIVPWLLSVLAGAIPFLAMALLIVLARLTGWLAAAPPGPAWAGGVPLGAAGVALLVVLVLVLIGAFAALRPLLVRWSRPPPRARRPRAGGGRFAGVEGDDAPAAVAVALVLVLVATTLVIWVLNPFAAALVVPALHLWLWLGADRLRGRRLALAALVLAGLAPPALVVAYCAHSLGLGALAVVWNGVLVVAGGQLGVAALLYWSVLLGVVVGAVRIVVRSARPVGADAGLPGVTVRGPVTYAGPGSLGGTESALRVRR